MKPDFEFTISEVPPLLDCQTVDAVCQRIKTVDYRPYRYEKHVFEFRVFEPDRYAGAKLEMFVRWKGWKSPPRSSKLYKVASIAADGLKKGQKITKKMFIGKAFACKLRTVGQGPAAYSVVDTITEKLAG